MKRLRILPLRVECRALQPIDLPDFKGTVLHGALGWAAAEVSPQLYGLLFPTEGGMSERATPNSFVLTPPLDPRTQYSPGTAFSFGITLLGCATEMAPLCMEALQAMAERGLGHKRGQFAIDLISQQTGEGIWRPLISPAQGIWLNSMQPITGDELPMLKLGHALGVAFLTPTAITLRDKPCQAAPQFADLLGRALGRASMVASELQGIELLSRTEKADILGHANSVRLAADATAWREVLRFSQKEERQRAFGGLLGFAQYEGELAPYSPWLALTAALQLGKKTSFGFGVTEFLPARPL